MEVNGDGVNVMKSGGGREVIVYVSWGGELNDGGSAKVTYEGGWTKCIVVKEVMGEEEVRKMVSQITENDLTVQKLWYSLKYDRGMVMELKGDGDVRMFVKGNDEHRYLFVDDREGPKRRGKKAGQSCDDGVGCGRNVRCRDKKVEQGRGGAGPKRAFVSETGRYNDDHPQSRMRVGGGIIELSDDDEMSVASEDEADDEEQQKEGKKAAKRMCHHDVWLKRTRTRIEKAITICRLQASMNNLKAVLLEKGHTVRVSDDTNMKLKCAVTFAEKRSRAWIMSTNAMALVIMSTVMAHLMT